MYQINSSVENWLLFLPFIALLLSSGCKTGNFELAENNITSLLDSLKLQYAPDSRTAIFSIDAEDTREGIILKGETNNEAAKEAIISRLRDNGISFTDSIFLLPDQQLNSEIFGVITISVGNVRASPSHASELTTQLLLGTPVKILKESGSWFQIQGPDKYIGWIDKPALNKRNEGDLENWLQSEKIIFKDIFGFAYAEENKESNKISDLVAGNILKLTEETSDYMVEFPDGRTAYVENSTSEKLDDWINNYSINVASLTAFAKELIGIPYLWGGTSVKGLDCSGFTKTVYFMNRQLLARDASQQVLEGALVDTSGEFEKLMPGDLLFFGTKDKDNSMEKVVHVGMWLGNNEYIHASGKVMINSIDPVSENYDHYNFSRYLRTKRMFNQEPKDLSYLKEKIMW